MIKRGDVGGGGVGFIEMGEGCSQISGNTEGDSLSNCDVFLDQGETCQTECRNCTDQFETFQPWDLGWVRKWYKWVQKQF